MINEFLTFSDITLEGAEAVYSVEFSRGLCLNFIFSHKVDRVHFCDVPFKLVEIDRAVASRRLLFTFEVRFLAALPAGRRRRSAAALFTARYTVSKVLAALKFLLEALRALDVCAMIEIWRHVLLLGLFCIASMFAFFFFFREKSPDVALGRMG